MMSMLLATMLPAACTDQPQGRAIAPSAVVVAPHPWPTPEFSSSQTPRILAFWMNETQIRPGTQWIGRIVTTSNVASLEVRTESFSFNAQRTGFGEFRFRQNVLDLVPQYKRAYTLQVIARNSAGEADAVLAPVRFEQ